MFNYRKYVNFFIYFEFCAFTGDNIINPLTLIWQENL